jgi:hypothetical protein
MVTTGNVYVPGADDDSDGFPDPGTNHMSVGAINNCLTTAPPGSAVTHNHIVHMVIRNVEDVVGWQARMNYIGDKMRVSGFNPSPFTDTFNGGTVGFTTLPLELGVHRDFVPASGIPGAPPDNTNTPQTALIGGVYGGAQSFGISPDTPQKAVHDETNQTYGTTGGGILATVTLQVFGNEQGQSLFMNLDDGSPNPPESNVQVFNGTGLTPIPISVDQLGDGFHGEGTTTCIPAGCTPQQCPPDTDNDGYGDSSDNCPLTNNPTQSDNDGDGIPGTQPPPGGTFGGDACDADDDNDGVLDASDNCPFTSNPGQLDTDGDGIPGTQPPAGAKFGGDACDADDDGDVWTDVAEPIIGTDPLDGCSDNPSDNAWPADMNNDTFIDTADIGAVTPYHGDAVPPAPARVNIQPDPPNGFVDTGDIGRVTGLFGQGCSLSGGVLATFSVTGEAFKVWVTNPQTVQQLFDLRDGKSNAHIPNGRILAGSGQGAHNAPWSWHLDPVDIGMAEAAIEVCDATPSYVEANRDYFIQTVGRYCPWSAQLVQLVHYR